MSRLATGSKRHGILLSAESFRAVKHCFFFGSYQQRAIALIFIWAAEFHSNVNCLGGIIDVYGALNGVVLFKYLQP